MSKNEPIPTDLKPGVYEISSLDSLYQNWFLDYASYVILERAVPAIEDGLKPVQRRILHAMKEMDDGRYNKVANIIGQTMQYHPHGDASISEAIVNLGQKNLLIDTQGNWGDIRTGDSAAAPRYIEARLSPFAHDILYTSPQLINWQLSYDGRKNEPLTFSVKFPLLLAQGVEGIAVGLATKILPHNFCEIIEGAITILKGKSVSLLPDFITGGYIDSMDYQEGKRGGKVRIRARIEVVDRRTLAIREIPYGITTTSLIDSIIRAYEKGKIKIKQVVDNTAEQVEILIHLPTGQSPEQTMDALYVFTDCEISVSPNACVIRDEKPVFVTVNELLACSTYRTKDILEQELKLQFQNLQEKILFASLEQLFIEKRIYRNIETSETWADVLATIQKGLLPYLSAFHRPIVEEDLIRLTEIKIKRISKYDSQKATEELAALEKELEAVQANLQNLTAYTIDYFKILLKKYGAERKRKTGISTFDTIEATEVIATRHKLYVNRKEGFIGYGLKDEELVDECSALDDVIIFRKEGSYTVVRAAEKIFVGKDIVYVAIYKKHEKERIYNLLYLEGPTGITRAKRLQVQSMIRDKSYEVIPSGAHSRILYITSNSQEQTETVTIVLTLTSKARQKVFDFNFSTVPIKGRQSVGKTVTKYAIKKIQQTKPKKKDNS